MPALLGVVSNFDTDLLIGLLTGYVGSSGLRVGYTWNAENRLVGATPLAPQAGDKRVEFTYDYMGRRIEKKVFDWVGPDPDDWAATPSLVRRFVWSGWLMLMELDGSNNAVRKYTWGLDLAGQNGSLNSLQGAGGIGGVLAVHDASSSEDYVYCYDANGNVGQLVAWEADYGNASGNDWHSDRLVASYEYDPYGDIVDQDGAYADANPFRFSTKYWDDETGLGYWGRRYYNPRLGRWMSRDPKSEDGGLNLYACCRNRPTILTDAIGLMPPGGYPPYMEWPKEPAESKSGCCGPDITRALEHTLSRFEGHFNVLSEKEKYALCTQMISPRTGDKHGWDIEELMKWGQEGGHETFNKLQAKGCGTGDCAGSVKVNGQCHRAADVNYLLWGKAFRLCHDNAEQRWTMHTQIVGVGTELVTMQRSWLFGDECLGGVSSFTVRWDLEDAVALVRAHRAGTAHVPGLRKTPNKVGAGTADCRIAWTRAGWAGSLSVSDNTCSVGWCNVKCCNEKLDWGFQVHVGDQTWETGRVPEQ